MSLTLDPVDAALTPGQAAAFLNVSRPYLVGLLDAGLLPCHPVGARRRIRLRDLQAFQARQDADSEAALAALQAQAQELNMGY